MPDQTPLSRIIQGLTRDLVQAQLLMDKASAEDQLRWMLWCEQQGLDGREPSIRAVEPVTHRISELKIQVGLRMAIRKERSLALEARILNAFYWHRFMHGQECAEKIETVVETRPWPQFE